MKNTFGKAVLFLLFSASLCNAQPFQLQEGSVLTYDVYAGGMQYQFIATIKSLDPVEFDYHITSENDIKGSVSISGDAMDEADRFVTFFAGGEMALDDATTLFICRECFYSATKEGPFELNIHFNAETEPQKMDTVIPTYFDVIVNGEHKRVRSYNIVEMVWNEEQEDVDYGSYFSILNDARYPLVLEMSRQFRIVLSEAENVVVDN